jgi:hypothetical protein
VLSGRNRESRSREAAGRRNSREAVPNGKGEMEAARSKSRGVSGGEKAKYQNAQGDADSSVRLVTDG